MQERRAAERLRTNINARWEALRSQGRGTVCDLSALGCFVLASAEVKPGELIRLELFVPEEPVSFWGQVVYTVAEIGFALRFVFENDQDKQNLIELIKHLRAPASH